MIIRSKLIMRYLLEASLLLLLSLYFAYGATQLITAKSMKRKACNTRFPKKDTFVSVIVPIRNVTRTTKENLSSVCTQEYPNYEVLFVAEVAEHAAVSPAKALSREYAHVTVLLSGIHDAKKCIAKCHNLVYAKEHAKGEILLFGDSDVTYSDDWVRKMTAPVGEVVDGVRIHATTAPFFMDTDTVKGKLITLPISTVTFTSSYTHESQRFPAYASGASIAVPKKLYDELDISAIWKNSFNDDLVLANTLVSKGYNLYNQHALLNHPNEVFSDWKQSINKLIRWTFTVYTFGNKDLKRTTPVMFAKNQQFQMSFFLSISLYVLGFSWAFAFLIFLSGYVYSVFYRYAVGVFIGERGMLPYYAFSPVMGGTLVIFHLIARFRISGFSWEGENYVVKTQQLSQQTRITQADRQGGT